MHGACFVVRGACHAESIHGQCARSMSEETLPVMLNGVFGVKHPVHLAHRGSSSKTRQNDTLRS